MPTWFDTQIGGALIQVVAAALVAWAVAAKGNSDRRAALTIAFDQEWNSPGMIAGRAAIERRLRRVEPPPEPDEDDFTSVWQVIMFVRRAANLKMGGHFDAALFPTLIQIDAGAFAARIYRAWSGWGATLEEWRAISPERLE